MSDLSLPSVHLAPSKTQLSVVSYFDPDLYAMEKQLIFDAGPRYLGHELSMPEVGDYYALPQEGEGRALVRSASGVELVSNVCRHRQAVMLRGRGKTGRNIVCPLHRWTYDLQGRLIGAPHFDHDPCLHLQRFEAPQSWNGLLFERNGFDVGQALAGMVNAPQLDFSGYVLDHVEHHQCEYNWKTFIEVYLEDYHVVPFHPGLGQFVSCDDLRWQFGTHYSVQTVGVNNALKRAGSKVYARWHDELLKFRQGVPPEHGAIWLTLYPNLMVEWYPHVLVVSALYPQGPQRTVNVVEFYYPEEIAAFEREFIEAERAAYMETCVEDDEIALRMDAGRLALLQRGDDQFGPYQSPMEDGMRHFHQWWRGRMGLPESEPLV
ncbi:MAG: aromatic ring-hydroxylating dioxygenase subunit alpha [Betaproteobacteria bacterium]|nr:aromatic ring-hydroxylating dioxygenase subunit alpha [Betaproteobacteria bacterium]MBU6512037.1 aromatic ring-hydroxylating dioxygenase subunit alpha [Betaproteobacteria bacterium]MDE1954796.1 aromatic ring-hydroxylating dioxygenase subunit alpha [Betaproteobacteria bacterium]MDE2152226.1 aromatic ring-hydroxylating dioxygenase subunit alpha [Betaproteobacteria bacterium]